MLPIRQGRGDETKSDCPKTTNATFATLCTPQSRSANNKAVHAVTKPVNYFMQMQKCMQIYAQHAQQLL
jgi:hypothetical protein